MSKLSEQLREALERFYNKDTYPFHRTNAEVFIMNNLLPLLTEYEKLEELKKTAEKTIKGFAEKITQQGWKVEKLEREAKAGKTLAEDVFIMRPSDEPDMCAGMNKVTRNWESKLNAVLAKYDSACEK